MKKKIIKKLSNVRFLFLMSKLLKNRLKKKSNTIFKKFNPTEKISLLGKIFIKNPVINSGTK